VIRPQEIFSQELLDQMAELTPLQRAAIPRLVRAAHEGVSKRDLLTGEDRICAWSTYYRPGRGWHHQEEFQAVLERAKREYDAAVLRTAVDEAAEVLRRTTPLAAQMLSGEVRAGLQVLRGDVSKDEMSFAERQLWLLIEHGDDAVKMRAAQILLRERKVARDRGLRAATGVLDRADVETAIKSAGGDAAEWRDMLEELRGLEDGEVADVGAEVGDFPEAGIPSSRGTGGGTQKRGQGSVGGRGGAGGQEQVDGE